MLLRAPNRPGSSRLYGAGPDFPGQPGEAGEPRPLRYQRRDLPQRVGEMGLLCGPNCDTKKGLGPLCFLSLTAKGSAYFLLVCLPRRQCTASLQTQCVRQQRSRHAGRMCSSSFWPMPAPLGAAAGCWPPSLLPPIRGSCWRVLVPWLCGQQGQPAGQRGLGAPWCWPGEQRSVAARMGVPAQGPPLTPPWCLSFPQAGLSPAGDWAVLVLPPPPSPGRCSSSPRLRYHWGLQGGVGSGRVWEWQETVRLPGEGWGFPALYARLASL